MSKIKIGLSGRKKIEVELDIDGEVIEFDYYEKLSKQIKEEKELLTGGTTIYTLYDVREKHFYENAKGDKEQLDKVVDYFDKNGNVYTDLYAMLEDEVGKQKMKG